MQRHAQEKQILSISKYIVSYSFIHATFAKFNCSGNRLIFDYIDCLLNVGNTEKKPHNAEKDMITINIVIT